VLLFALVEMGSGKYSRTFWGRNLCTIQIFPFSEEVIVSQKHLYIHLNVLSTV